MSDTKLTHAYRQSTYPHASRTMADHRLLQGKWRRLMSSGIELHIGAYERRSGARSPSLTG